MRRSSSRTAAVSRAHAFAIAKPHGTVAGIFDPKALAGGWARAEREQGITIDVAYRYFRALARRRRFIVADTPGHKDDTRNMVTGASTSDLAILLVTPGRAFSHRRGVRRLSVCAVWSASAKLSSCCQQDGSGQFRRAPF